MNIARDATDTKAIRYRVGTQDTILQVNGAWLQAAEESGTPGLEPSQVLGQPLWRFISGLETRHLYEMVLRRVRQTEGSIVIPFRCDSVALRRFMEMTITALPQGEVEFVTRLVHAETRSPTSSSRLLPHPQ